MSNKRKKAVERKANQKARMAPLHQAHAEDREARRKYLATRWSFLMGKRAKKAA